MIYTIKHGNICAKIARCGAQLISLTDTCGEERMWNGNPEFWNRISPMLFPICGRLLNNEYKYKGKKYLMNGHGFARDLEWTEEELREDYLRLSLKESAETLAVYPFRFGLCAEFSVLENGLALKVTVTNTDDEVLPYMYGWHPGFKLYGNKSSENFIELPEAKDVNIFRLAENTFPTEIGEPYALDNQFIRIDNDEIGPADTLILRDAGYRAVLRSDASDKITEISFSNTLPVLCIWKIPVDDAAFVCIEPWSDTPADGNSDEDFESRKMERLDSGKSKIYEYKISF